MTEIMGALGIGIFTGTVALIFSIFVSIFNIICMFKIFNKSGESSWKAIIPFYNQATLAKISDLSPYLGFFMAILYFCVEFVTSSSLQVIINLSYLIYSIILTVNLAKKFNFSAIIAILGMFFFPTIFYAILAFGPFTYIGSQKQMNKINHAFNLNGTNKEYEPQSDFFRD